jgi:isoleucyl-tRNA synthetase
MQAEQAPGLALSSEGEWTVALDTTLDEELINEGWAREFVNRVQNMRKDAGFDVVDRIRIYYEGSDTLWRALEHATAYVKNETLAEALERRANAINNAHREEWEINGEQTTISIERA